MNIGSDKEIMVILYKGFGNVDNKLEGFNTQPTFDKKKHCVYKVYPLV